MSDATIVGRSGCSPYVLTPKDFRRKAKEAEAMAEAARDQIAKEMFLDVAERWNRLADQADGTIGNAGILLNRNP